MKKYNSPKIKSVEINAEQAVLQVCMVEGGYFEGTAACIGTMINMIPLMCENSIKGSRQWGNGSGTNSSDNDQPS